MPLRGPGLFPGPLGPLKGKSPEERQTGHSMPFRHAAAGLSRVRCAGRAGGGCPTECVCVQSDSACGGWLPHRTSGDIPTPATCLRARRGRRALLATASAIVTWPPDRSRRQRPRGRIYTAECEACTPAKGGLQASDGRCTLRPRGTGLEDSTECMAFGTRRRVRLRSQMMSGKCGGNRSSFSLFPVLSPHR